MLPKPEACRPCPMWQDGRGFVPDEVIEGAPVYVIGQNPGVDEEREGRPFVGRTGQAMEKAMFPVAQLTRGENVSIGNAIRCRWQGSNELPPEKILKLALEHCTNAHFHPPAGTRLLVAQGGLAIRAITRRADLKVTEWRGFLLP